MTVEAFFVRGEHRVAYVRTPAVAPPPDGTPRAGAPLGILYCSGLATPMAG
jgi:hypothetical protein